MKKLRLDLDTLSVDSFTITEPEDLRGTVAGASYTREATQCSHMNMCGTMPLTRTDCM